MAGFAAGGWSCRFGRGRRPRLQKSKHPGDVYHIFSFAPLWRRFGIPKPCGRFGVSTKVEDDEITPHPNPLPQGERGQDRASLRGREEKLIRLAGI